MYLRRAVRLGRCIGYLLVWGIASKILERSTRKVFRIHQSGFLRNYEGLKLHGFALHNHHQPFLASNWPLLFSRPLSFCEAKMNILSLQYCNNETETVPVESIFAQNDVIGLFFTVPTSVECVAFIDSLMDVYQRLRADGKKFEVLQVDCSQVDAIRKRTTRIETTATPPPWRSLQEICVAGLASAYRVRRVPALVILRSNGEVISFDYCSSLDKLRCSSWERWMGEHVIDRMPPFIMTIENVN